MGKINRQKRIRKKLESKRRHKDAMERPPAPQLIGTHPDVMLALAIDPSKLVWPWKPRKLFQNTVVAPDLPSSYESTTRLLDWAKTWGPYKNSVGKPDGLAAQLSTIMDMYASNKISVVTLGLAVKGALTKALVVTE